jgi:hypothetical protein
MRFIGWIPMVVLGCASTASTTTTTITTTDVSAVTSDRAIADITDARCAREFSCDNIGAGRVWHDYDACTRDVRLAMHDMLVGQACQSGVDSHELSACIADLRNQHCASEPGTVARFGSCSNARLCR